MQSGGTWPPNALHHGKRNQNDADDKQRRQQIASAGVNEGAGCEERNRQYELRMSDRNRVGINLSRGGDQGVVRAQVCYPTDDPYHQAALAQGAKDEQTRRKDKEHRGFASDELRSGKTAEGFPGAPNDHIHTLRP